MAAKDTFEPHTFGANSFAAGTFRGVGVTIDLSFDEIGLEYTAPSLLIHYTAPAHLLHYTAPENDG